MYTMTYSFKKGQNDCYGHCRHLGLSVQEMLSVSGNFLRVVIEEFQLYLTQTDQKIRPYEESVYELLVLGTIWRTYANKESKLTENSPRILSILGMKEASLKSFISPLENFLSKMSPEKKDSYTKSDPRELNMENLDNLLQQLEATDEFRLELKKLRIWREFLYIQESGTVREYLRNILIFADWFKKSSKFHIGNYNTKEFLYYLRFMENDI